MYYHFMPLGHNYNRSSRVYLAQDKLHLNSRGNIMLKKIVKANIHAYLHGYSSLPHDLQCYVEACLLPTVMPLSSFPNHVQNSWDSDHKIVYRYSHAIRLHFLRLLLEMDFKLIVHHMTVTYLPKDYLNRTLFTFCWAPTKSVVAQHVLKNSLQLLSMNLLML